LPWWRQDGSSRGWFRVCPIEVKLHPEQHPEHMTRLHKVDLTFPVHVLHRHGQWMVLDGIHRLLKADIAGAETIVAAIVRPINLSDAVVRADEE
jgi:hypothetical protein